MLFIYLVKNVLSVHAIDSKLFTRCTLKVKNTMAFSMAYTEVHGAAWFSLWPDRLPHSHVFVFLTNLCFANFRLRNG